MINILKIVDLAKENKIPEVLSAFNEIVKKDLILIFSLQDWEIISEIL
jgi:hypothetical protein